MTNDEKHVYDKLLFAMKQAEDYYDENFDAAVKAKIETEAFKNMSNAEQLEYLNNIRDNNDAN